MNTRVMLGLSIFMLPANPQLLAQATGTDSEAAALQAQLKNCLSSDQDVTDRLTQAISSVTPSIRGNVLELPLIEATVNFLIAKSWVIPPSESSLRPINGFHACQDMLSAYAAQANAASREAPDDAAIKSAYQEALHLMVRWIGKTDLELSRSKEVLSKKEEQAALKGMQEILLSTKKRMINDLARNVLNAVTFEKKRFPNRTDLSTVGFDGENLAIAESYLSSLGKFVPN